jgi:acetoin utilization deacetylase AcuC-like enzyme
VPLYLSHPASFEHDPRPWIPGHPDTPQRIVEIEAALEERGWLGWERREAPAAPDEWIVAVHTQRLLDEIRDLGEGGGGLIDVDTAVGPFTLRAARHAAGGAAELARALLAGEHEVGVSACRPSGHHAEPDRAMGFCYFGNVAIAAALALRELGAERVLVLDWDVHHGNGTEACFADRDDVLFVSIHQMPLYPGTGAAAAVGRGAGEGYTLNLPVAPGSEEAEWLALLDEVVAPRCAAYDPDLVLVSAGYDAHREDPLAGCLLETSSYAAMATRVLAMARAAGAPLGIVMEGGYHVPSLVASLIATMEALDAA